MSMLWTTILTSAICLLSLIVWVVAERWRHQARRLPPGLPAIPILGSLPFFRTSGKSHHLYFMDLSKRYGNLFSFRLRRRYALFSQSCCLNSETMCRPYDLTEIKR